VTKTKSDELVFLPLGGSNEIGMNLNAYGFGPDGVSSVVNDVTRGVVRLQTGYLYHYAFAMMIGIAALISWFMFGGAH
jgi:hypothetical protein